MKKLKFLPGIVLVGLFLAVMAGCGKEEQKSDPYTPLFVYFYPLNLDVSITNLMPYFVNYPTDCDKMGLRGRPMTVTYEDYNQAWNITSVAQYTFCRDGDLLMQARSLLTGNEIIAFEYGNDSNLVKIITQKMGRYENKESDDGFTYDAAGRLVRRDKNGRGHYDTYTLLYTYHENGALKSISPERKDGSTYESGITFSSMQFDSLANMVYFETPRTTNMFLKDLNSNKKGKSVTTYSYTGHLCTKAVEKIPIKFDQGTETLTCTSNFTYNSQGDLASWTYSGGVYKEKGNSWRVDDMTFTISFDYVYDEHGNWTQAKITFPANIDEIPALRLFYKASKNGIATNRDYSPSVGVGEIPVLTVKRTVEYMEDEMKK